MKNNDYFEEIGSYESSGYDASWFSDVNIYKPPKEVNPKLLPKILLSNNEPKEEKSLWDSIKNKFQGIGDYVSSAYNKINILEPIKNTFNFFEGWANRIYYLAWAIAIVCILFYINKIFKIFNFKKGIKK